ncbi:MAG: NAD(P)/FAD-dependent oxidoreductase [Candidatus Dormibacteraeota bacterium]|nr:NAD(P)/FAD-dependent oxidoreductase [Candidatus Dormibacteraeota bacterium]MBO0704082.1 NAD(P)/FAD-dependent oxidoreductase [Candidatus Dormibacteraeota bacterium]MBO0760638.1 NAD(P)/FAD-dependent oxidoreductase [Candidatus Dormibacteraeota bacterium]
MSDSPPHVVIMGAGPAGLTAALELMRHGASPTVLERDPRYVGGIARTVEHEGYRFDIGGHRFFSKNQEIEDLWTEILGDQLLTRRRLSRIYYRGRYFDYPLKLGNALANLGPVETVRCLGSYVRARLAPVRSPRTFEDWVSNQFGRRLFEIFFKTYTEKVWGIPTSELSADWAAQRIKGLDLAEVARNALTSRRPRRREAVVKTLVDEFRYPRLGPGQMWERASELLAAADHPVRHGWDVQAIRHQHGSVTAVEAAHVESGRRHELRGDAFVSTLPIRELVRLLAPAPPPPVREAAEGLNYRDFLTVGLVVDREELFPDNWIYVHEPDVRVGRLQNFKNWSPGMVADPRRTGLGLEYFCFEGDGLWTAPDPDLIRLGTDELARLGICRPEEVCGGTVVRQPKAYPVYDDTYRQRVGVVREWIERELPNLHLCGRNGMHKYNNQDHSMMTALLVARGITKRSHLDPWNVNSDAEYQEELREGQDSTGRTMPARG